MKEFEEIRIKFIEHKDQRYDTAGDYYLKDNILLMFITKEYINRPGKTIRNRFLEFSYLIHEMAEVLLVIARNIPIEDIDKFDMNYKGRGDPGMDKDAPYRKKHIFATKVHKMLEKELGI